MNIITNEKMEISEIHKSVLIRESDELSYCKSTWRRIKSENERKCRINIYHSNTNKLIKHEKSS